MNKKVKTEGRLNRIYQDDKIVEYNIAGLSDGWHIIKYLNNNKYCLVSDKELEQIKEDADKWFNYYDIDFYKSVASLVNAFKHDAFMGPVVKNIEESKEMNKDASQDNIKQLANDILNWFGSDMGTWFDEIQGNEEEAYDDILFILEDRNEEQIQNLIDTIEEADIDDETAKKVNIATTSSLISRLKNLLSEDNKEVKTESNDYDYIKDRKDIILALEGLKEDLLKIPNVTKVEFDTAQYADGIPGPITLVYFDIKEDGPKYFDEKEILLNRILNTMEINGVNVELDELEDNDTYFYIVAYSTNWGK